MKVKRTIFAISVAFLVLAMNFGLQAVDTREIDKVRDKQLLDSKDFQIIDNFVDEAVRELVGTEDFADIATIRTTIWSYRRSKDGEQGQYAEQFSKSAHKYISEALKVASGLTPEDRKFKVTLNLLILVDSLEDARLADLAMGLLNDENTVIRYWAVHSVTSPGIIKRLNSRKADDLKLASEIVERLEKLVDTSGPEITALMARFAAEVVIRQGEDLLLQIADIRISKYADWTVDYELLDATILKLLYQKMSSAGPGNPAIARRFAQLYSYVIQRYVKGQELNAVAKHQLASVLVEVESCCIWRLLGTMLQTKIKRAVEQDDMAGLLLEHNRLLGDETRPGQLPLKLKIDYGTKPDGSKRIAPLALPDRPKKEPANKN